MRLKYFVLLLALSWLFGAGDQTQACEATGGTSCGTSSGTSSQKTPSPKNSGGSKTKRTPQPQTKTDVDEQFQDSGTNEQFGTNQNFDLFNAIEAARQQEEFRRQNEIAIRNQQLKSQQNDEISDQTAPVIDRGDFDTSQSRCPAGKGRCTVDNSVEKTYEKSFKRAKKALQSGQPIEATRQAFKGAKECAQCAVDGLLDGVDKLTGGDGQQGDNNTNVQEFK